MTLIRIARWRLLMIAGGILIALGGRMHPEADASGTLSEELAEMTADDAWVPGHTLLMLGTVGLVWALWRARAANAWPCARRMLTAAAMAMGLYSIETVFHLAAVLDAEHLADGDAAPLSVTHIGLAILLYPVSGVILAAFGARLMMTETGVRRAVAILAVVAGVLHANIGAGHHRVPRCRAVAGVRRGRDRDRVLVRPHRCARQLCRRTAGRTAVATDSSARRCR